MCYDSRVCEQVGGFYSLADVTDFDAVWCGYQAFKCAVVNLAPEEFSLRDKDRYLIGKSFHDQLERDIGERFGVDEDEDG